MADPMQYTGYTYDNSLYKQPTESMADYMSRLAAQRAAGVLGGGGMLDTPTPITETDPVLGTVTQSCPAGFVLQNGACVRVSHESGIPTEQTPNGPVRRTADNKYGYVDPASLGGLLAMAVPFGSIAMGLNNADAVKAAQQAAGLEPTGFFDRLFTNPIDESIGTKTINDRDYKVAIGGGVVDKPSIISTMFSSILGNEAPQGSTSLTPVEAMRRSNMANYGQNWATTPYAATSYAAPSITNPRAVASSALSNALWQDAMNQGMLSGAGSSAIDSYLSNLPPAEQSSNYIQDTGSGITTSGSYNDSGDWSWSGTDFSAPAITSDGNDWSSW